MKDVLVAYGSRMGGTTGLAEAIGARLERRGLAVETMTAASVESIEGYRALVVGSAIYNNRWRSEVLRLLQRIGRDAPDKPLWLFHSGPLGNDADDPQDLPKKVGALVDGLGVVEVRTFGGRLPEKPPGLVAKLLARKMSGDFRKFEDVFAWADTIADALDQTRVSR